MCCQTLSRKTTSSSPCLLLSAGIPRAMERQGFFSQNLQGLFEPPYSSAYTVESAYLGPDKLRPTYLGPVKLRPTYLGVLSGEGLLDQNQKVVNLPT